MNTNKVKEICPCCLNQREINPEDDRKLADSDDFTRFEIGFIVNACKKSVKVNRRSGFTKADAFAIPAVDLVRIIEAYKTDTPVGDSVKGFVLSKLFKTLK